jgi:hypothetical protein
LDFNSIAVAIAGTADVDAEPFEPVLVMDHIEACPSERVVVLDVGEEAERVPLAEVLYAGRCVDQVPSRARNCGSPSG